MPGSQQRNGRGDRGRQRAIFVREGVYPSGLTLGCKPRYGVLGRTAPSRFIIRFLVFIKIVPSNTLFWRLAIPNQSKAWYGTSLLPYSLLNPLSWRLPTFAMKTIIGTSGLNCSVRNGKRCDSAVEVPEHYIQVYR